MENHKVHLFCLPQERKAVEASMAYSASMPLPPWQELPEEAPFRDFCNLYDKEDRFLFFCRENTGRLGEFILALRQHQRVGAALYGDGARALLTVSFTTPEMTTVSLRPLDLACERGISALSFYRWGVYAIFWYLKKATPSILSAADEIRRYRMGKQE